MGEMMLLFTTFGRVLPILFLLNTLPPVKTCFNSTKYNTIQQPVVEWRPQPTLSKSSLVRVTSDRVSLEILTFGAHILSWKVDGTEQLYLSPLSKLDGSKPIRGGIPLIFPQFAKPKFGATTGVYPGMPMHGFARISNWSFVESSWDQNESQLTLVFSLNNSQLSTEISSIWKKPFKAKYKIRLHVGKGILETKFQVENLSQDENLTFDVLFHNYLATPNLKKSWITGLQDHSYLDKNANFTIYNETKSSHTISNSTDHVYMGNEGPNSKFKSNLELHRVSTEERLTVSAKNIHQIVVWNPYERKTDDLPSGDYLKFVCIEPGRIGLLLPEAGQPTQLAPMKKFSISQRLSLNAC